MEGKLYKKICTIELLMSAWTKVKEKGSAGGIDRVSIKSFEAGLDHNINELSETLSSYNYIPEPYKEIKIPKDDNEFRSLSLPCIKDKIVQQAVKDIIEPVLEKGFLDVSYAYRLNKGAIKAINRVSHMIIHEKREWVTLCDIDRYFDNIDHNLLFSMLSEKIKDEKLLPLIHLWIKMGKVDNRMRWIDTKKGIPQGNIISPLLSNYYLHTFDIFMCERHFGIIRYSDDFVILSHSEGEAYRGLRDIRFFLDKRLKLKLNPGPCVKNIHDGFEFLGILFKDTEKIISKEKMEHLKEKIAGSINLKQEKSLNNLNETLEGIHAYYGRIIPEEILEKLDEYLVEYLKDCLNKAYQVGLFRKKGEIKGLLSNIKFLSKKYRLFNKRTEKGIVAYCRRRIKEETYGDKNRKQKSDPIKRKKREYQRLESAGFEMLITTPGVFIGKTRRGISVKEHGIKRHEAPLLNLKNISILSRGVTLSSNVIEYCTKKNISIDFIGFDGKPYAKIYAPCSVSASIGIAQLEAIENGRGCRLAKCFVSGKIRNQINLVKYYNKYRKGMDDDFNEIFDKKIRLMESLLKESRNIKEPDMEVLRGRLFSIEGRAASSYWELIESILNDFVAFEGRVRRGATDLVNSLLNYGYGILYSRIWEAILKTGLNPYISYLHKPQPNKPTLVFDLIEEFRQQGVDRPVFSLITKGEDLGVENGLLKDETRRKVAEKVLERINSVEIFRSQELRFFQIIKGQARTLAQFLEGKVKTYKPYAAKW